jgi:putative inorganic carbon (hco3(-)) transporter
MKGLILVYIVTYVSAVVALVDPLIGLYTYVGLSILRPQFIFGFAGDLSGLSEIVGYALLIGWTLKKFGSWQAGRASPVILALLAFTGWFCLSAVMALDTSVSYPQIVFLAKLVLPFLVGATMLKDEKDWRRLMWTIVLAQGYVGFEQNLNYLKGFNTAQDGFGGMDNNFFGVSLVTVIGPAITLTIVSKKWYQRLLAAAAAALILHTTMLTYSRGAMVGMLAVGTTAFLLMPKRPKYIGALLIVALVAVRLTGPQLAARYMSTFAQEDQRDYSSESRVDLWKDCLKVIQAYPLLGVGPANWRVIASSYGWSEGKSAHSVWMETAAEIGIPGVLMLMLFFGLAAARLWPIARGKLKEEDEYKSAIAIGVVLSIVGFAVAGQFVSAPGLEPPYWVAMLGVALLKSTSSAAIISRSETAAAQRPVYREMPVRFQHPQSEGPATAPR